MQRLRCLAPCAPIALVLARSGISVSMSFGESPAKISPTQSALTRAMHERSGWPSAVRLTICTRRSLRQWPAADQALLGQTIDQTGDVAVRHHHALGKFAQSHAVRRAVELRQQIEARQSDIELFAQPSPHLALDQRRAGQQPQPQPQLGLVVVRALGHFRLGVERNGDFVVHHTSPPATTSVVPVTAAASGEHR